jgi:hypothetical protein
VKLLVKDTVLVRETVYERLFVLVTLMVRETEIVRVTLVLVESVLKAEAGIVAGPVPLRVKAEYVRDGVIERETDTVRETHLVIVGETVGERDRLVVADFVRYEAVLDILVVRVTLPSKLVEIDVVIEILALFTGVIVRVEVVIPVTETVCERDVV